MTARPHKKRSIRTSKALPGPVARAAAPRGDIQRRLRQSPFEPFFFVVENGEFILIEDPERVSLPRDPLPAQKFQVISREFLDLTVKYRAITHIAWLDVEEAIRHAESILPGTPVRRGSDPRWQAIILVGEFIETHPEQVWNFIVRWGRHRQVDLRTAIAVCLLEHLLEYHFDAFFPEVERTTQTSAMLADTFLRCWKFGQSETSRNSRRFDRLIDRIERSGMRRKKAAHNRKN